MRGSGSIYDKRIAQDLEGGANNLTSGSSLLEERCSSQEISALPLPLPPAWGAAPPAVLAVVSGSGSGSSGSEPESAAGAGVDAKGIFTYGGAGSLPATVDTPGAQTLTAKPGPQLPLPTSGSGSSLPPGSGSGSKLTRQPASPSAPPTLQRVLPMTSLRPQLSPSHGGVSGTARTPQQQSYEQSYLARRQHGSDSGQSPPSEGSTPPSTTRWPSPYQPSPSLRSPTRGPSGSVDSSLKRCSTTPTKRQDSAGPKTHAHPSKQAWVAADESSGIAAGAEQQQPGANASYSSSMHRKGRNKGSHLGSGSGPLAESLEPGSGSGLDLPSPSPVPAAGRHAVIMDPEHMMDPEPRPVMGPDPDPDHGWAVTPGSTHWSVQEEEEGPGFSGKGLAADDVHPELLLDRRPHWWSCLVPSPAVMARFEFVFEDNVGVRALLAVCVGRRGGGGGGRCFG